MLDVILDISSEFNANSGYTLDTGGWDYIVVQLVSPSSAVSFNTTNDGGNVGSYENATSAANFTAVQGVNLATGAAVTSLNATGLVKFTVPGKYLQLTGTSVTATKVLIRLAKVH